MEDNHKFNNHAYLYISQDMFVPEILELINKVNKKSYDIEKLKENSYDEVWAINGSESIKKATIENTKTRFLKKSQFDLNKILIVNHAEKMTSSAANTFLKFLEESPEAVVIILITSNLNQVIGTIRSRCRIVYLNNLSLIDSFNIKYKDNKKEFDDLIVFLINCFTKKDEVFTNIEFYKLYSIKENFEFLQDNILHVLFLLGSNKTIKGLENKKLLSKQVVEDSMIKISKLLEKSKGNLNKSLFIDKIILTIAR